MFSFEPSFLIFSTALTFRGPYARVLSLTVEDNPMETSVRFWERLPQVMAIVARLQLPDQPAVAKDRFVVVE